MMIQIASLMHLTISLLITESHKTGRDFKLSIKVYSPLLPGNIAGDQLHSPNPLASKCGM